MVRNEDQRPEAYKEMETLYRPSHADYTYQAKYGIRNWQGGGRASARETIGRVAGAALLALGVACWFARGDALGGDAKGLVAAMLLYNVAVAALLAYAAIGLKLGGPVLWPAVILHAAMAVWCIACLRCASPARPAGTCDLGSTRNF